MDGSGAVPPDQGTVAMLTTEQRALRRARVDIALQRLSDQIDDDVAAILAHGSQWQFSRELNERTLTAFTDAADTMRALRDECDLHTRSLAAASLDTLDDDDMTGDPIEAMPDAVE